MKRYKKWFIIVFFVILVFLVLFIFFRKTFRFKFSNNLEVELGNKIDGLVTACYGNYFKCNEAKISNKKVDTSKVGTISVKYTATYENKKKNANIKIKVVDKKSPVIEVESDPLYVCPKANEYDINFKATDNYDGDLTKKVKKNIKDNKIYLFVSDSSGNTTKKIVDVKKEDITAPEIKLKGDAEISISINSQFNDPGYEVTDNCDDVTNSVKVEGSVNTSEPGTYTINYSVSDLSGNTSSVSRKVVVYKPVERHGTGVIYLTFDDGPSQYTSELLDVLSKYNVKATFFVTGRAPGYNYNITRAYKEGHAIGLHTNTHNYNYVYSSIDAYFEDLNTISNTVKNLTGYESKLLRFPGGSSNTVSRITPGIMSSLSSMVRQRGYQYFDWNVSSGDASGSVKSSDVYASNVINSLGSGSYYIVLQHDTNGNSVRAVSSIIEYGKSHGYSFDKLSLSSPTVHHKIAN